MRYVTKQLNYSCLHNKLFLGNRGLLTIYIKGKKYVKLNDTNF